MANPANRLRGNMIGGFRASRQLSSCRRTIPVWRRQRSGRATRYGSPMCLLLKASSSSSIRAGGTAATATSRISAGDGAPHRIQARSTWTSCAVSAFQRRTPGLKVDGIVGPANAAAMRLKRAAAQPATTDGGRRGVVSPSLDAVAGACRLRRPGVRHLRCHLRRGHRETGRRIVGLRAEIHADHLTVEVDDGTTARARLRK